MTLPDAYSDDPEPQDRGGVGGAELSKRSRAVALGLCLFGGFFGLHRFYVEKPKSAIAMILTIGGLGVWWLYDLVLLAAGEFRDADDLPLRRWAVEETPSLRRSLDSRGQARLNEFEEQMDGLRQQINELAERVDFAERMLAQQRERPPLPRGS